MASNNLQDELQTLKDDVVKLRADIAGLIELFKDLGVQKVHETRDSIDDELQEQREKLRARFTRARERGRGVADELEQHVTEHPIGCLMTAFGIGYILAKLSGDRS